MHRRVAIAAFVLLAAVFVTASSCDDGSGGSSAREEASEEQRRVLETIGENQPIKGGTYSPTKNTIQRWLETWTHEEGKVAYIYFTNGEGDYLGYYVLDGLPVSYCTSGTPTYDFENRDAGQYDADFRVPAPAMDGVWYSGSECQRYYAFEAETGAFLDWTSGLGISQFVTDQPIRGLNLRPYVGGSTTPEDVTG